MGMFEPSEPKGASQSKHAGVPPTRKPTAAGFSIHFEEPGSSVDGGDSDTGAAEPKASSANMFGSTGGGGGGATSKPNLFAANFTAAPYKPSLFPVAPKPSPYVLFQNIAPSAAVPKSSTPNSFPGTANGGFGTALTGGVSDTYTATTKPHGRGGSLFADDTPLYGGEDFGAASTVGSVFGGPNSMGSPNYASGAPRTSDGGWSRAGNIFSVPKASSITQDGMFGRPASKYDVPDKRVAIDQAIDLGSAILTINAGEDERQRTFTTHENLIASRSTYMKTFIAEHPETRPLTSRPPIPTPSTSTPNSSTSTASPASPSSPTTRTTTRNTASSPNSTSSASLCKTDYHSHTSNNRPQQNRPQLIGSTTTGSMQDQEFPMEFMNDLAMSFVAGRSVAFRGASS